MVTVKSRIVGSYPAVTIKDDGVVALSHSGTTDSSLTLTTEKAARCHTVGIHSPEALMEELARIGV